MKNLPAPGGKCQDPMYARVHSLPRVRERSKFSPAISKAEITKNNDNQLKTV